MTPLPTSITPTVAVAIASYNRCETTLRCLTSLLAQKGLGESWTMDIHLLDDESPDGTAANVAKQFPSVTVISGTGSLFWGGGMEKAMKSALAKKPDFILMLNDDVELTPDAVQFTMAEYAAACTETGNAAQVIIGAVCDPVSGDITYSGFKRLHRFDPSKVQRIKPSAAGLVPCDTMNGNFVLIPKVVFDRLGAVDPRFVQQLGDIDYGYRVVQSGGGLWIARHPVGSCAPNLRTPPWRKTGLGPVGRWRALNTPLGMPLRSWTTFMWRWGGVVGIVRLGAIYTLRIIGVK